MKLFQLGGSPSGNHKVIYSTITQFEIAILLFILKITEHNHQSFL